MKTFVISAIMMVISLSSFGQEPGSQLKTVYDSETIYQYGERGFMLNNKVLKRKDIRNLLLNCPESSAEYKLFQKRTKVGNAILIVAAGLYVSSFFVVPQNPELAIGLLGGSVGTSIVSIPFHNRARKNLQKAVWLYNGAVLSKVKS